MKTINKRTIKLCTALIIGLAMIIGGFAHYSAQAMDASELVAHINTISPTTLNATQTYANTVTVTGSASVGRTQINLNIDDGVTVIWQANLTAAAIANTYALNLSGSGSFTLENATLTNTGAGGTVYIGDPVELNVGSGGIIDSPGTSGSAVTIPEGIQDVVINVTGGTIRSTPGGYAINDGSIINPPNSTNNTRIYVNTGGVVEAGTTSAIRSTGIDSVVRVNSGGLVTSSPASNVSPVISMTHTSPTTTRENVIVNGGTVRTTHSGQSYVIQTSQSVRVEGNGLVQSIAGRGINLIGMDSIATIRGGGAVTTVSGTAISTATETYDRVVNASVIVENGGRVEATGAGHAIYITGVNNTVTVSGDQVSGGQVLARNGFAINVESRVEGIPVTVNGGFVFAWVGNINNSLGSAADGVVRSYEDNLNPISTGAVVAWNTTTGVGATRYHQEERNDLVFEPSGANVFWEINPNPAAPFDGINVEGAWLSGNFFGLNVEVIQQYFILTILGSNNPSSGPGTPEIRTVRAGTTVNIAAAPGEPVNPVIGNPTNYPVNGSVFNEWRSADFGDRIGDPSASATTFTMPYSNATVSATYSPRFLLRIIGGVLRSNSDDFPDNMNFGSPPSNSYGYFPRGREISIEGNTATFNSNPTYGWQSTAAPTDSGTFANYLDRVTVFTMPGNETMIYAMPGTFPRPQIQEIITEIVGPTGPTGVITGTTTEDYDQPTNITPLHYAGTNIEIEADTPLDNDNKVFRRWEIREGTGFFDNAFSPNTVFVMLGTTNVRIEAVFDTVYTLTVNYGSGSGTYRHNTPVVIEAELRQGERFQSWTSDDFNINSIQNFNPTELVNTFTMPQANFTLTANYTPMQFTVTAHNGSIATTEDASGSFYNAGRDITVNANPALEESGMRFDRWIVASGDISHPPTAAALRRPELTFTMPADNVVLIATYTEIATPQPPQPPGHEGEHDDYDAYADYDYTAVAAATHGIPQTGDCSRISTNIALLIGAVGAIITTLYFGVIKKRFM